MTNYSGISLASSLSMFLTALSTWVQAGVIIRDTVTESVSRRQPPSSPLLAPDQSLNHVFYPRHLAFPPSRHASHVWQWWDVVHCRKSATGGISLKEVPITFTVNNLSRHSITNITSMSASQCEAFPSLVIGLFVTKNLHRGKNGDWGAELPQPSHSVTHELIAAR